MSEKLEWEFKLTDHVSGPAGHVGKSLHDVKGHSEGLIHKFHDLEHIAEMSFEAIEKLAEIGERVFEAMEFKESTLIGLKAITGSAAEAEEIFKQARDFANVSGQPLEEIVTAAKRLKQAGVPTDELRTFEQVLSDIKVTHGASEMGSVEEALVKMSTSGKVTERTMLSLNTVAGLGGRFQQNLAKDLHVSTDQLKKMIEAGKVPASWGRFALAQSVAQMNGGKLGASTKEMADTLGGSLTQLKNELKTALQDLIDPEALAPFAEFIREVAHEGIPALMAGFKEVAPSIQEAMGAFKEVAGPGVTVKDVFQGIGRAAGWIAKAVAEVGVGVAMMVKGWDLLINGVDWGYAWEQIAKPVNNAVAWMNDLPAKMGNVGRDIIVSLVNGFTNGLKAAITAIDSVDKAITDAVVGGLKSLLGIHSPSKVFEELGAFSAEGFNIGLSDGINLDLPKPRAAGGAGGSRGTVHFSPHINVTVQGGASGGTEGSRRLADHIVDLAMEKLMGAFEELQLEAGS